MGRRIYIPGLRRWIKKSIKFVEKREGETMASHHLRELLTAIDEGRLDMRIKGEDS